MEKQQAGIAEAVDRILETIPSTVVLVAAAKGRTVSEIRAAIAAGITCVGHNYIQQAEKTIPPLRQSAAWHMIGHLQRNKLRKAVVLFDMIETIDSIALAEALDRQCAAHDMVMPVLIEINSGREPAKTGVLPENAGKLAASLSRLEHVQLQGVMTMGPRFGDPEAARPYFQITRGVFESVSALALPNVTMRYLSMGMSNTYRVAIQEGANIVRIGTAIFGSCVMEAGR
ncbi:MAG: YggS family pyridoxal phosphate-dependent enzyme [Anaerolineae bacterium]|nr:YggS family pyridoxal phosphate-dependent enzyme [Anaerolineae bacterium]